MFTEEFIKTIGASIDINKHYGYIISYDPARKIFTFKIIFPLNTSELFLRNMLKLINKVSLNDDYLLIKWIAGNTHVLFNLDFSGINYTSMTSAITLKIFIGNNVFLVITVDKVGSVSVQQKLILSISDTRRMAQYNPELFFTSAAYRLLLMRPHLLTDLHTHFDGVLYPTRLVSIQHAQISEEELVKYKLLERTEKLCKKTYFIEEFGPKTLTRFLDSLAIPSDRQVTFNDLERIYDIRELVTGKIDLFSKILYAISIQYKQQEIEYVELSLNNIVDACWLSVAHECLPKIEQLTGVKLRFLAAIYNYHDEKKIKQDIENLKSIYESPYIVGIDFAGHETLPLTSGVSKYIEDIANWASKTDKEFIIRVHAGETKQSASNVKTALLIAKKYNVRMRIGHAIYNIDEETLELAEELSKMDLLIIEFTPDSDIALNNICSEEQIPLLKFLKRNVPFVLGTDGGGIYNTTPSQLIISLAKIIRDRFSLFRTLEIINSVERKHISKQNTIFERKAKQQSLTYFTLYKKKQHALTLSDGGKSLQNSNHSSSSFSEPKNNMPVHLTPILIVSNYLPDIEGKSSMDLEHLKKALNIILKLVDLRKTCFILTGFGKVTRIIQSIFLEKMNNRTEEIIFYIATDKGSFSNSRQPLSTSVITNSLIISDTITNYSEKMVDFIKQRAGVIFYIEGDYVGHDICLHSKNQKVPILAINPDIKTLENNKNINHETIVSEAKDIATFAEKYLNRGQANISPTIMCRL